MPGCLSKLHTNTMSTSAVAATPVPATPVAATPVPATDAPASSASTVPELLSVAATGPACWGPVQWQALHQMARGYPRQNPTEEQKKALVTYVTALGDLLPCHYCSMHWKQIAPTIETATGSRHDVLKWTIDVHNSVNARLHKPVLSYADAVKDIESRCAGNMFSGLFGAQAAKAGKLLQAAHAETQKYMIATGTLGAMALALAIVIVVIVCLRKRVGK